MKSYTDLLREIEALKKENAALKAELDSLRHNTVAFEQESTDLEKAYEQTIIPEERKTTETDSSAHKKNQAANVHRRSTPEEKIALFRKLFAGRDDVFARRWQSKTTGKSGYQPVCANEWESGLCDKKKYKCADCPNRKLMSLTDRDIYNHLAGKDPDSKDVIGIYPMLTDETCRFCCLDFDDGDYQAAATAFQMICEQHNVPAYTERSRSGSGAHVWIFFETPISAKTARQFASALLTCAMQESDKITFKSYDRMFPNQDTMPQGGFGNLIALPLQGLARKHQNSVFVDEQFRPYEDQWAFLSECEQIGENHITEVISTLGRNELGNLIVTDEKPWEPKKKTTVSGFDFPANLTIIRADRLYIPKDGLSANAKNQLRRLAAFRNPDFYRTQAMRMPVYNKPRIISCSDEDEQFLMLPRGCEEALTDLLDSCDVVYTIQDKTNQGKEVSVSFNGELRDEQKPATEALLSEKTGVLSATTAFGKTVIAAYLISQRRVNTLILVHTQALMMQWKKSLEHFLIFDVTPPKPPKGRGRKKIWSPVGVLGAGKHDLHGIVDVAVMQSLADENLSADVLADYGMVIVDECHHVSAVNFEAVLKQVNARCVYGLTATPVRADGQHPIIFMQCGPIRYRVDAKAQAKKRPFNHYLLPRFTSFRKRYPDGTAITQIYDDLMNSNLRNQRIVDDVISALSSGKTPLVMTERKEHVAILANLLKNCCKNLITLTGRVSPKEKQEVLRNLERISPEEPLIVIATGKYIGEGFDYPRFDALFLALPISWKGKLAQYAGRLHRDYPGKTEVIVYDYADIHIPMLEKMYQRRLKGYAAIGYQIKSEPEARTDGIIYDSKSFLPVYRQDISDARHEVIIVSPFMRMSRLKSLKALLSEVANNGISVSVVTRPPEDFTGKDVEICRECTDYLKSLGVNIQYKREFHQKFTVIDNRIVWYGSINFLSFGKADESILRFESGDLANALLDSIL